MGSNLLITGNSTGLGRGLAEVYLEQGWSVYGLSRRGCSGLSGPLQDIRCDLQDREAIPLALETLLNGVNRLDLVILNAGILGEMKDLHDTSLAEIEKIMEVNVWSNKLILDWLIETRVTVKQIVLISSGAAVSGNRGWSAYGISKAALNMLTALYAYEFPDTHLSALAPGIIDTAMQSYLCSEVDSDKYPTAGYLKAARDGGQMPDPIAAARTIAEGIPQLLTLTTGSFADIRKL